MMEGKKMTALIMPSKAAKARPKPKLTAAAAKPAAGVPADPSA